MSIVALIRKNFVSLEIILTLDIALGINIQLSIILSCVIVVNVKLILENAGTYNITERRN